MKQIKIFSKYFFIIFFLLSVNVYSQYFLVEPAPLQKGNYWLYTSGLSGNYWISFKVLDSTMVIDSSLYYVIQISSPNGPNIDMYYEYNRLDSNNFYISYDTSGNKVKLS